MNILKRIHFFFIGLAAVMATFAFPALAAGLMRPSNGGASLEKSAKVSTLYQNGMLTIVKSATEKKAVVAKLTTVNALMCAAVNMGERYFDVPTTGPVTYVYAVPISCVNSPNSGTWFNDPLERIDQIGSGKVMAFFEGIPMAGEPFTPPRLGYAQLDEKVDVAGPQKLQMKIGNDVITAYSYDTIVPVAITGTISHGDRATVGRCTATGCIGGGTDSLPWGLVTLFPAISVPPGSAILGADGSTVGAIIGNDQGMFTGMLFPGIREEASQLGINLGGKG